MGVQRDPDLVLVESMVAPPPLDDARSSLEYWRQRRKSLPFHRRAARREAGEMAARWEGRVLAAERARFEASPFGRLLAAVGFSNAWGYWVRLRSRGVFRFAWAVVPRKLKLAVGAVLAAWLVMVLSAVLVLAVLIDQLS